MVDWARNVGNALAEADDSDALRRAAYDYGDSLNKSIVALDRAIHEHWRMEAIEKFQPLVELGKLLSTMNIGNNLGRRLADCGEAGLASTNTGLAVERLRKIKQLLADHQALQHERGSQIGDDEVGKFIKALADNRATLDMVTTKVWAWLIEHEALGSLGVTTRQRGSAEATNG
jgi:hypothetical protein